MARSELIKTAHCLRDLGRYPEAHEYYSQAANVEDDLILSVDFASMLVEQGQNRKGLDQINVALARYRHSSSVDAMLAVAEMFQASVKSGATMRFADSLKLGIELYEKHLLNLSMEEYKKELVQLLGLYLGLRHLAELCGLDVSTAPTPSEEHLELLYLFLLRKQWFWQALQISKHFSRLAEVQSQTKLLAHFILQAVSDLEKANAFEFLADLSREALRHDEALKYLESARDLYGKGTHVTGLHMVEMQMIKLRLPGSSAQRQRDRLALMQIKQRLEELQYPFGVRQTIMTLYNFAQEDQDDALRTKLDQEMQKLEATYNCPLQWIMTQHQLILHWDLVCPSRGQMLQPLEAMWDILKDSDVPIMRVRIASTLSDKYCSLGNEAKGRQWATEAENSRDAVPRRERFMHGTDEFYRKVIETSATNVADEYAELHDLREELLQILEDVKVEITPPSSIYFGISKVINLCAFYTTQHKIRGFTRTQKLVETCLEYSDTLICNIPRSQHGLWIGNVLQTKGTLLVTKANSQGDPKTYPANLDKDSLASAVALYEEAARMYHSAGFLINFAMVQQHLATCYQMMWHLEARSPNSKNLRKVVQSREAAGKILKRYTRPEFQRTNELALLGLWSDCSKWKVKYIRPRPFWRYLGLGVLAHFARLSGAWRWLRAPQWFEVSRWFVRCRQFLFRTPYEEAVLCLKEIESLIDEERQNLSALGNEQALLAKQNLSRQPYMSKLHETVIVLLGEMGDEKALWEWVQRSKARSLSDMLGLGVNLPGDLRARIEADPKAKELIDKEEELVKQATTAAATAQFLARKQLETHRKIMRLHDHLRQVLELREGKPVSWARLKTTSTISHLGLSRRAWYVDWFVYNGTIFLIVVSEEKEDYRWYPLAMNVEEVQKWALSHLSNLEQNRTRALNDQHSLAALACLAKLVQPLLDITQAGDLLVLCMIDILHKVPIHAAVVQGNPEEDKPFDCTTLIERNPIIYTSSMTIFQQCTNRASATIVSATRSMKPDGVVLSVYEDPIGEKWESEREKWYNTCEELAENMGWGEAMCGTTVTKTQLQTAFEASLLHFSGHFYDVRDDILSQGIVLAAQSPTGNAIEPETSRNSEAKITMANVDNVPPERVFSVRDVFKLPSHIKSSHVSLVACSSASQAIQTAGDEPLGFVTALLLAGATSVMGTLWRVDSGTGRRFCRAFYDEFDTNEDSSSEANTPDEKNRAMIDLAVAWQDAVRTMRGIEKYHLPYHWAGYVVHGTFYYPKRESSSQP
jgi:CHAT domain-containing protein